MANSTNRNVSGAIYGRNLRKNNVTVALCGQFEYIQLHQHAPTTAMRTPALPTYINSIRFSIDNFMKIVVTVVLISIFILKLRLAKLF